MKKLVIIPAYNEEKNIKHVVEDIVNNSQGFDYVVINDSSADDTKSVCVKNGYNFVNLPVNLGIGGAVQTGYLYAYANNYDIVVQFDGDGQHDARYLNNMFEYMNSNKLDMLIGSRFIKNEGFQSSFARRIGIVYFSILIRKLTGATITDPTSGYRMINRDLIKLFCQYYPKDYPEPESVVTVLRNNYLVGEMPVIMKERENGESSINFVKSFYYMVKVTLAILIDMIKKRYRRV
jgi:glycosyltransferase involved in cell wall biosynthesis